MPGGRQVRDWLLTVSSTSFGGTLVADAQGMATEVQLPPITYEFDEVKRSGNYSAISYPLSPGPLEIKITLMGASPELLQAITRSIGGELTINLNGSAEDIDKGDSIPYRVTARGPVSQIPLGNFQAQENAKFEFGLKANYIRRVFGVDIFEYDPRNWILNVMVNGVPRNLLESRRQALGLT